MTTAANITVKKADGTTDIVWQVLAGSGGDSSPAFYRSNTATGTVGQRPTFQISTKWNGPQTARRVEASAKFPSVYTNSTTGQTEVRSTIAMTVSFGVPTNIVATDVVEAASQLCHLLNDAQFITSITNGYAPT